VTRQEVVVSDSALKRGHAVDDILHALRNAVDMFEQDEGFNMVIGPAYSGQLLELGLITADDNALIVVHCMDVRRKFLR
jgi:hypothetical protein